VNFYCISMLAYSPRKGDIIGAVANGIYPSEDEAYAAFMQTCAQRFPRSEGYQNHTVSIQYVCSTEETLTFNLDNGEQYVVRLEKKGE
jgi:hypothetical protein